MQRLPLVFAALATLAAASADAATGVTFIETPARHHARPIDTAIFYPASAGTGTAMGENGVFHGTPVAENAPAQPGPHPLILLSHGWGGNYRRMSWLGAGLVDRGAIVVAVNHPHSTTGETTSLEALNHWTRAQDLSAALDAVLDHPQIGPLVDPARIHAAGFSYGGWTALSLGGVRGNLDGLRRFCEDPAQAISHCADILRAGITLSGLDAAQWRADWKDGRIASVAAIDPALTWGLSEADVAGLDVPLLIVGLGSEADRLHATDTSAGGSGFEALVPGASVLRIAPAYHFSALGLCKPDGARILEAEGDDPVCSDPAGTDRAAVLSRIVAALATHFRLAP